VGTYVSYYGRQLEGGYDFAERQPESDEGSDGQSDAPSSDPPTGDVLRTYRLALITDPGYAAYHGGPANVTAAKVALMNRVDQVYEDDLSIRMQLIPNNDLLNLNTWAAATAPNGPAERRRASRSRRSPAAPAPREPAS
jgi:Metallo-peptidase family M12B Reprolysin-like